MNLFLLGDEFYVLVVVVVVDDAAAAKRGYNDDEDDYEKKKRQREGANKRIDTHRIKILFETELANKQEKIEN
jgi:hypothetical protein